METNWNLFDTNSLPEQKSLVFIKEKGSRDELIVYVSPQYELVAHPDATKAYYSDTNSIIWRNPTIGTIKLLNREVAINKLIANSFYGGEVCCGLFSFKNGVSQSYIFDGNKLYHCFCTDEFEGFEYIKSYLK